MLMTFFLSFPFFFSANDSDKTVIDTTSNYIYAKYVDQLEPSDYQDLLDSLTAYGETDFFYLRMAFTKTKQYSPYSVFESQLIDSADKYTDLKDYTRSLTYINQILDKNYCYIPAHSYAGYLYKQLDDSTRAAYHQLIYTRLLESIESSGNGFSPNHAFWVISTREEYAYLRWNGWSSGGQSLVATDGHSFDLHKVRDKKNNQEFELYFNVSLLFQSYNKTFKKK